MRSAVSGRKRPGTAPRKARAAVIRNGALSDNTDWEGNIFISTKNICIF